MNPRKLFGLVMLVALATGLGLLWARLNPRRVDPPPFPCIATAKSGWLTAVTIDAMVRLEWEDGVGRISVGSVDGPVSFKPRDEASVRALALEILAPISTPVRSTTSDSVSLFAGCDGVGAPWRGESSRPETNYRDCVRPFDETRPECLVRVFRDQRALRSEAPGAVADRILSTATKEGAALSPHPRSHPMGLGSLGYGPYPPPSSGLIDRVIDFVSPPPRMPGPLID